MLDAIRVHMLAKRKTKLVVQNMGLKAYALLECYVEPHELYVKVQLPTCDRESEEVLIVISAHESIYMEEK